jgi:hypothetical protein
MRALKFYPVDILAQVTRMRFNVYPALAKNVLKKMITYLWDKGVTLMIEILEMTNKRKKSLLYIYIYL